MNRGLSRLVLWSSLVLSTVVSGCSTEKTEAAAAPVKMCLQLPGEDAPVTPTLRSEPAASVPLSRGPVGRFKVGKENFAVWDGTKYRDVFIRAMDMGASQPGSGPNDLNATYEDYACWLAFLRVAGFNAIRLYSVHFPVFYQALADHNNAHPDSPLYLFQGVYLPEPKDELEEAPDLRVHAEIFDEMLRQATDVIHGKGVVPDGRRGAFGTYTVDVSDWTIGWLVGREVLTKEAIGTKLAHPKDRQYEGKRLRLLNATPTEFFMAQRLDGLVDYETTTYGLSRPFAWSNWLELDPLDHPTDRHRNTRQKVDFAKLDPFNAPAGHFVSYHIYPYYPDFLNDDPGYATFSDELGRNSYLGLLTDLRKHHDGQAFFVAEFGVPSSWASAHTSSSGMHHGGLSEEQQGIFGARMMRNIASVGAAGFAYFQLTDGWWKRIWITNPRTFPAERLRYWHDLTNAQQSYGLIAFAPDAPDWDAAPVASGGRVRSFKAAYDAEFVRLDLVTDPPVQDGEQFVVGLDTYADDRGETVLPNAVRTKRRNEFALVVTPPAEAEVKVMSSYDLRSMTKIPRPDVPYRSTVSDTGAWNAMSWIIFGEHTASTWSAFRTELRTDVSPRVADELFPLGKLRARRSSETPSSLDAVVFDGGHVTVRIPWTLLNFVEAPRHVVMDDDPSTSEVETALTDGIAYSVSIGDSLVETERLGWPIWRRAPATHERLKAGAATLIAAVKAAPGWLDR